MKKSIIGLVCVTVLFSSIGGSIAFATESNKQDNIILSQDSANDEIDQDLYKLANLSVDDILHILESEGIDPYTLYTEEEIQQQRFSEMLRAGVNQVFHVNDTIRDIYVNSFIATTLKSVGIGVIGSYIGGWTGIAVGAIGANVNTSNGIIIRVQKQNGHQWGVNGAVWAIIGVRSQ